MPAASITDAATPAITIPAGAYGIMLINNSDTTIYYLIGQSASASNPAGAGVAIPVQGDASRSFSSALSNPMQVSCYHNDTGATKTLTYEFMMRPMSVIS